MNKTFLALLISLTVSVGINYLLFISPDWFNSIIYSSFDISSNGYLLLDMAVSGLIFLWVFTTARKMLNSSNF